MNDFILLSKRVALPCYDYRWIVLEKGEHILVEDWQQVQESCNLSPRSTTLLWSTFYMVYTITVFQKNWHFCSYCKKIDSVINLTMYGNILYIIVFYFFLFSSFFLLLLLFSYSSPLLLLYLLHVPSTLRRLSVIIAIYSYDLDLANLMISDFEQSDQFFRLTIQDIRLSPSFFS